MIVLRGGSKGRMAAVEGRLQIRNWTDDKGNNRRSAEIVVDNVYFGDSKKENGNPVNNATPGSVSDFDPVYGDDEQLPF